MPEPSPVDQIKSELAVLSDGKWDWRDVRAFAALLSILAVLILNVLQLVGAPDVPANDSDTDSDSDGSGSSGE